MVPPTVLATLVTPPTAPPTSLVATLLMVEEIPPIEPTTPLKTAWFY